MKEKCKNIHTNVTRIAQLPVSLKIIHLDAFMETAALFKSGFEYLWCNIYSRPTDTIYEFN